VLMNMNYRQQWQRIKGWLLTREGAAEGR
jgi:hypothetical protein